MPAAPWSPARLREGRRGSVTGQDGLGIIRAMTVPESPDVVRPEARTRTGDEPTGSGSDPLGRYADALKRHGEALTELRAEVRRLEAGRLASFLVAAVVGLLHDDLPIGGAASLAVSGLAALIFVALVVRHRRLRRIVRRVEIGERLARVGRYRLRRQWDELAGEYRALGYADPLMDATAVPDERHPYVEDLDLFGEASVRTLLGPTPTPTGIATLRRWFRGPAAPAEVARRQEAVRALVPDFDGREALATEALLVEGVSEGDWATFRRWLEDPPLFGPDGTVPTWSVWIARLLPPVTAGLALLDLTVGVPTPAVIWAAPLAVQGALAWRWGAALGGYFGRSGRSSRGLRRYHALLRAWESYGAPAGPLRVLQQRFDGGRGVPASGEIRRLERWLDAADSRASMLHFVVAWGALWDVHVAWGLERWRAEAGAHVPDWLDALGELEALSALAALAHDHPDWCWPELVDGEPCLIAEQLGHPLLGDAVRRPSDAALDPPGRFLLVTGSNMSGKSTLLRSLGLAAVMAQAGSVVCARRLRVTPLRTFTSMRIHDSVTEGVSLFMAELNRLKELVDAADRPAPDGSALLYLIDEVLQGTNSDERRIAARRIVRHLLGARAIGAVTTHDLSLHEDPALERAATKVHFRERVGGGEGGAMLTFDYKLREGLATSRNALKLLEIVGLGEGPEQGVP